MKQTQLFTMRMPQDLHKRLKNYVRSFEPERNMSELIIELLEQRLREHK